MSEKALRWSTGESVKFAFYPEEQDFRYEKLLEELLSTPGILDVVHPPESVEVVTDIPSSLGDRFIKIRYCLIYKDHEKYRYRAQETGKHATRHSVANQIWAIKG